MEEQLYKTFYEIEKKHWWFVARQRIVEDSIQRRVRLPQGAKVLDVGCGTGAILEMLSKNYNAYGTDTSALAIELCGKRGLKKVYQCTLETFPHQDLRFDLITLLDVIEHIDDDVAVLEQAQHYLKPGGSILVTVPAYQWLWSKHDDVNHHKRRYVKSQMKNVLESAGFKVEMITYYNTLLFPAALVGRLAERVLGAGNDATLNIPSSFVNSLLTNIFASEKHLLNGIRLPFGLSLLSIAKKRSLL